MSKTDKAFFSEEKHQKTFASWALLRIPLLLILTPAAQIAAHAFSKSGLFDGGVAGNRVPLGILINERDNMSYASWAQQAKLGHLLGSDLYTTTPHSAALFNPYFVVMGLIARISGEAPYLVMVFVSILSSGLFGFIIYKLGRQTGLQKRTAEGAAFIALFCSGPSWLLFLFHAAFGHATAAARPFLGIDGFYFDIFPVTIFLSYPFASFNLLWLAFTTYLINRALLTGKPWVVLHLLSAALACACAALIRPYDALILCALFPATVLFRNITEPGFRLARFLDGSWICLLMWLSCFYVYAISQLPVWRDFARNSIATGPNRLEMIVGFSVLWIFSTLGLLRARRERNTKLIFLVTWALPVTGAILVAGGPLARFSDGLVIPYSILSAYGISGLRNCKAQRVRPAFTVSIMVMLSSVITSVFCYFSILLQPVPTIDVEVNRAASFIRERAGRAIPTVLTDCATAAFLPGIAGLRVFAGHWSLTPDYTSKCKLLSAGGLAATSDSTSFDPDKLLLLIDEAHPDYILLRHGSSAEHWLLTTHRATTLMQGARWSTMSASIFSG